MRPMRTNGNRVKLEGEARRVQFRVEVAGVLRPLHRASDSANPFMHDRGNAVAYDSQPAIELERSRCKKASTFENSFFDEDQPMIDQRPQSGHALGSGDGRARHLVDENVPSHFDGGQLQFFLRAKVGEKAALAHTKLLGEGTNGKTFQALSGGYVDGAGKDGFASAEALGLAPEHGFIYGFIYALIDSLFDKRFAGIRAESAGHENTVTQDTHKHERSFTVLCFSA